MHSTTGADALLPYLTAQVEAVEQLEPLVREDAPDSLHKMRVALRRTRSCLLAFRGWFAEGTTDQILLDLKWIGAALAPARDLEVVAARVRMATHGAGTDAARRLSEAVLAERTGAFADALAALDDERWAQLTKALRELVDEPQWREAAHGDARGALTAVVAKDWRKVAKAMHKARTAETPEGHEERLHEVRKRSRRLRYVTEVARPALGWRCARLTIRLVHVQDILGRHNDAYVASSTLLRIAPADPDVHAVAHQLAHDAVVDDARFSRSFERLERSRLLRRFR